MKGCKIGSALAAFESNIAKNNEHGSAGGKSFLTGVATSSFRSNSSVSVTSGSRRERAHSIGNSNMFLNSSIVSENSMEDDGIGYTVRWSPRKVPLTVGAAPRPKFADNVKISALPFGVDSSESSHSFTELNDSFATAISDQSGPAENAFDGDSAKKIKKVVIVRKRPAGSPWRISPLATKSMIKMLLSSPQKHSAIEGSASDASSGRGTSLTDYSAAKTSGIGSSQDLAYCSPTDETENSSFVESPEGESKSIRRPRSNSRTKRRLRKSPLDKISATLKRENTGSALRVAAQAAATKITALPPKKKAPASPPKNSSSGNGATMTQESSFAEAPVGAPNAKAQDAPLIPVKSSAKKLSLHVHKSTPKACGIVDKSISSLPIVTNDNATAAQTSFSSLPISHSSALRKVETTARSTVIEAKGIGRAARRSSITSSGLGLKRLLASTDLETTPTIGSPERQEPALQLHRAPNENHGRASPGCRRRVTPPTSKSDSVSSEQIDMEYEECCSPRKNKFYPRSPMPVRTKLTLLSHCVEDDDDGDDVIIGPKPTRPVVAHDANRRTLTAQLANVISNTPSAFSTDISLCTLDLNSKPVFCPRSPMAKGDSNNEDDSEANSVASSFEVQMLQPIKLKMRDEVVGILRRAPMTLNTIRRVKFADQQPGGGRRMSSSDPRPKDCLPMRPRRSIVSDFNRLNDEFASSAPPLLRVTILAATKIQSIARRWTQWKSKRVTLLERKLARIEASRKDEIAQIQAGKWKVIETIQAEIVEKEKRLESQVALGEKLADHLKRDSSMIKDQTKHLRDYCNTLKRNNDQFDQSIRLHFDNFSTMSTAVELLRDKSEALLASSKKYATKVDRMQTKLEETSSQGEREFQEKRRTEKAVRRIISLIRDRCHDDQLVSTISAFVRTGGDDRTRQIFALGESSGFILDKDAFELRLRGHDNDEMSVFSDITDFPGQKWSEKTANNRSGSDFDRSGSAFSSNDSDRSFRIASRPDYARSAPLGTNNSFASYSYNKVSVPATRVPAQKNDSFADYNRSKVMRTPANASAPARHISYRESNGSICDSKGIAEDEECDGDGTDES